MAYKNKKCEWDKLRAATLLNNFPKIYKKYQDWCISLSGGTVVKNDYKDYDLGLISSYIRFFEINDILIEVGIDRTMGPKFAYQVWKYNPKNYGFTSLNKDGIWLRYTRMDAKIDAILEAFKFMEKNVAEVEKND